MYLAWFSLLSFVSCFFRLVVCSWVSLGPGGITGWPESSPVQQVLKNCEINERHCIVYKRYILNYLPRLFSLTIWFFQVLVTGDIYEAVLYNSISRYSVRYNRTLESTGTCKRIKIKRPGQSISLKGVIWMWYSSPFLPLPFCHGCPGRWYFLLTSS